MKENLPPDILNELINIGFGRAANALSILVRKRISLQTPMSEFLPVERMGEIFSVFGEQEVSSVHQGFGGSLNGNLALLLTTQNAAALLDLVRDLPPRQRPLEPADQDDLREIGNILLNAFYGTFGNLLNLHITFALAEVFQTRPEDLLAVLTRQHPNIQYVLIVKVHFRIDEGEVEGYVVVLLGLSSIELLVQSIEEQGYLTEYPGWTEQGGGS